MVAPTPVILEVALNGVTPARRNPAVPVEPAEIAADALRCFDAGAAIVHTHPNVYGVPAKQAAEVYAEAYREILSKRPEALLYPTAGFGGPIEERHGHHDHLAREGLLRIGLLDPGSVNLGAVGEDGLPSDLDLVYTNSPRDIRHQLATCERYGLGGSIAIFEPGFLRVVVACQRAGTLPRGSLVKLYFSSGGYLGAGEPMFSPPPLVEALELYLAMLRHTPVPWAVALLGGSLLDSPLAGEAVARGGHLRVGLEDHPDAESNVAEVLRAGRLCESHGRRLASPAEAAEILGLPERP